MTEKEIKILSKLDKLISNESVSNDFLVQLIELAGSYLNLSTIPDYARQNNMSYNGVKKYREIVELFGVKYVINND